MSGVRSLRQMQYADFLNSGLDFLTWYKQQTAAMNTGLPGMPLGQRNAALDRINVNNKNVPPSRSVARPYRLPSLTNLTTAQKPPAAPQQPPSHLPLSAKPSPFSNVSSNVSSVGSTATSATQCKNTPRQNLPAQQIGAEPAVIHDPPPLRLAQAVAENRLRTSAQLYPTPSLTDKSCINDKACLPDKGPVNLPKQARPKVDLWRRRHATNMPYPLDEIRKQIQAERSQEDAILRKAGYVLRSPVSSQPSSHSDYRIPVKLQLDQVPVFS